MMDAVNRLLLLAAQRRGTLTIDLTFATDVALTFQRTGEEDQSTVCEADLEAAADALAAALVGSTSVRRPSGQA